MWSSSFRAGRAMKSSLQQQITKDLIDAHDAIQESFRSTWDLLQESIDESGEFNCDPEIVNLYKFWNRQAKEIITKVKSNKK